MDAQTDKPPRRLSGTYEWAEKTINIQRGCEHDCRYCYARYNVVSRFGRCTREEWATPKIFAARVDANYHRLKGRIMFPSTHDITPLNINECLIVIKKLLEAGNDLLLVSKPTLDCVQLMCEVLKRWRHKVTFRFTIGSTQSDILRWWEPGASGFTERLKSLSCAYMSGYATSVSCEPYLDPWPHYVYEACRSYISDSFWVGKLRHWQSRVDLTGASEKDIEQYVEPLQAAQSDVFVHELVRLLDGRRYVRWKDSIRDVIEKEPQK